MSKRIDAKLKGFVNVLRRKGVSEDETRFFAKAKSAENRKLCVVKIK